LLKQPENCLADERDAKILSCEVSMMLASLMTKLSDGSRR
jgi:hypothetical protein